MHVLAFCPIAAQCWEKAAIRIPTQQDTSFLDWCVSIFSSANTATCRLFCVLCWSIWGARNDKVWKNKDSSASFIFAFAVCYLEQWTSAQAPYLETSRTGLLVGDGNDRWCAPNANEIKVNVDASIFGSSQDYGYGMVARDEHGFMLEATSRLCHGYVRPELAKAIGVREALSWIKNKQWPQVTLETDSNLVAHTIARAAISYPDRVFSMENVPTDLLPLLVAEFEV
ncbi:hypothetical protein CsatB_010512 [Cannabis sativa]